MGGLGSLGSLGSCENHAVYWRLADFRPRLFGLFCYALVGRCCVVRAMGAVIINAVK